MSSYKLLQVALVVIGGLCCLLYPLSIVWPSGWSWHDGPATASNYYMMIVGVYATLGLFLILAARDPHANRSLILFTIWSSLVHAAIMTVQAMANPIHYGHLVGDVPALVAIAAVLGGLLYSDRTHQAAVPA
jgi:FtsH-binding integral membrane protein